MKLRFTPTGTTGCRAGRLPRPSLRWYSLALVTDFPRCGGYARDESERETTCAGLPSAATAPDAADVAGNTVSSERDCSSCARMLGSPLCRQRVNLPVCIARPEQRSSSRAVGWCCVAFRRRSRRGLATRATGAPSGGRTEHSGVNKASGPWWRTVSTRRWDVMRRCHINQPQFFARLLGQK